MGLFIRHPKILISPRVFKGFTHTKPVLLWMRLGNVAMWQLQLDCKVLTNTFTWIKPYIFGPKLIVLCFFGVLIKWWIFDFFACWWKTSPLTFEFGSLTPPKTNADRMFGLCDFPPTITGYDPVTVRLSKTEPFIRYPITYLQDFKLSRGGHTFFFSWCSASVAQNVKFLLLN